MKRSFLEGRSFTDLTDLNAQLTHWLLTVANQRVHGTTKAVPAVQFEEELSALRSARLVPPFNTRPVELMVVSLDCHLSYRGVRYSVMPEAAGHTVVIRASGDVTGDVFTVMLGERVVAEHRIRPRGTPDVTLAEHPSDEGVAHVLLAAVRPEPLSVALRTPGDAEHDLAARREAWRSRLERARYAADRAWRQYDAVELTTDRTSDRITCNIVWRSGARSQLAVSRPVRAYPALGRYPELIARLRELASEGRTDKQIAATLEAEGLRPARARSFHPKTIWLLRHSNGIAADSTGAPPQPAKNTRRFTVHTLADELGVFTGTVYPWLATGRLHSLQHTRAAPQWIDLTPSALRPLRAHVDLEHQRGHVSISQSNTGAT